MPHPAFSYHVPGPKAKDDLAKMRQLFSMIGRAIEELPASRERALAMTNLEQAAMWTNKAVVAADPESVRSDS